MTEQEKKEVMGKYAKKLEATIKTEKAKTMELEDDKFTLKALQEKKQAGAALETTAYESWDTWIAQMEKEIKAGEAALTNIEFKKILLEAVKAYAGV